MWSPGAQAGRARRYGRSGGTGKARYWNGKLSREDWSEHGYGLKGRNGVTGEERRAAAKLSVSVGLLVAHQERQSVLYSNLQMASKKGCILY